jgi:outer membrane lipoprotein SlyB
LAGRVVDAEFNELSPKHPNNQNYHPMKSSHLILLSSVVFALAGCGNQGSSNDPYGTNSTAYSPQNNDRGSMTNDAPRGAMSQGPIGTGIVRGTNDSGLGGTNNQGVITNSTGNVGQPLDALRTNNLPVN